MGELFVEVAINVPINKTFTYSVPEHYKSKASAGKRALVSFGKKFVTGLVISTKNESNLEQVKSIKAILDEEPIINSELMDFCNWMSSYYLAPLGEVVFSVIPKNFNIRSEIYYLLSENYKELLDSAISHKSEILIEIINLFEKRPNTRLTKSKIEHRLSSSDLLLYINRLTESGILIKESLYSKPTKEKTIKILKPLFDRDDLNTLFKEKKIRTEKQKSFLRILGDAGKVELPIAVKQTGISPSSISSLASKGLVSIEEERQMRLYESSFTEKYKTVSLNDEQQYALKEIKSSIDKSSFKPILLHGITGSGKTEVYLHSISYLLSIKKTAIVLVPEISLTPQLIHRFQSRFGDVIGVIHSQISDGEKLDTYDRIRNGNCKIIIGARSALFAPLKNIGAIIVDEEHDSSYKQQNSPRYHGRDSAIYRAKLNNAVVILGSATPSMESYYNARIGRYKLLELSKRASTIKPPEIKIVDLKKRDKDELDKYLQSHSNKIKKDFSEFISKVRIKFLSRELIIAIDERLDKKESTIILQNRRGYHSYIECLSCSNVEMCPRCSISLTYHKIFNQLKCHYCGFNKRMITNCSNCSSDLIIPKGAGTERVEEELVKLFPTAVIRRMDSDVMTSRKLFQEILQKFYDKEIDILVGTQMISKGLDFPDVTLVGVVNADIGLLNPDFRATEKTFQILTQVAGRSGRSEKAGEVFIQTNHSEYFVFETVKNHDYLKYFENELALRKAVKYPPFSRIALIEAKADDLKLAESKIKEVYNFIAEADVNKSLIIFPPNQPLFSKLRDMYRYHLLIRSMKDTDPSGIYLNSVLKLLEKYCETNIPSKVHIIIDMDAVDLM